MAAPKLKNWQQSYTATAPQQDNKKVVKVRRQSWVTKGEKFLYAIFGVILILVSTYVVSFSSQTDSLNRELQKLENVVQSQQLTNEGLAFEVKELSSPDRITEIAKKHGLTIQNAKVKQASAYNN
ncbi:cell division protein FtsL [Ornithinibacillus gellani]|uniref:cell division protein FtsL n=1 Tax=Ornithinibacillus gellani TaxID=2293253 RepID=UPI000F46E1E8|nr:cell division protein FtsL [Ornithinibacillus gellani]TQS75657.1 cell division protein FtsL [Ornithinibacillus gellani]